MLKVVEDGAAIARYQRRFVRALRQGERETIPVRLAHPGADEKVRVTWLPRLGLWFHARKVAAGRFWNAFGLGRPESGADAAITCEINFPLAGIDRRIGGAFAEDRTGRVLVVHRGKLGGRRGVGKTLFERHHRGVWERLDDGGGETAVAVVGVLDSPRFARQLAQFVRKIAWLKAEAAPARFQGELGLDAVALREELIGERYREAERETGSDCDRGLLARDLAEALAARGFRAGNDDHRDLLLLGGADRVRAVFELLPDMSPESLHAGATRLLLNGLSLPGAPRLVLTLPRLPDQPLQEKLRRLHIDLLTYAWEGDRARFPGLADLLPPADP